MAASEQQRPLSERFFTVTVDSTLTLREWMGNFNLFCDIGGLISFHKDLPCNHSFPDPVNKIPWTTMVADLPSCIHCLCQDNFIFAEIFAKLSGEGEAREPASVRSDDNCFTDPVSFTVALILDVPTSVALQNQINELRRDLRELQAQVENLLLLHVVW